MPGVLIDRIRAAHAAATPLVIRGHGSKDFYGNPPAGEVLETTGHAGIVDYQPRELVLVARAGTPLAEIEAVLAEHGQWLAFEPPRFGGRGTLGGAVAAGLSGPARVYTGAVRDFVLGCQIVDGTGQVLNFGGRVIKNVAGYDVSRLMAGAMGTLGLITEVALKVLPRPAATLTLQFECDEAAALARMNAWAGQPLPLTATSWHAGLLSVRLGGAASAVRAARAKLGGEVLDAADDFWARLRDHRAAFFGRIPPGHALWRIALPSTAPAFAACLPGDGSTEWIEWGGALRWIVCDASAETVREAAHAAGGHATRFSPGDAVAFTPLPPALLTIHKNLKARFDPAGILNRGRLDPEF